MRYIIVPNYTNIIYNIELTFVTAEVLNKFWEKYFFCHYNNKNLIYNILYASRQKKNYDIIIWGWKLSNDKKI